MPITISEQREFELQFSGRSLMPREIYNGTFRSLIDLRTKTVFDSPDATPLRYSAFPRCPAFRDVTGTLIGMTVDGLAIIMWSDGVAHGDSDRVMLALVNPVTLATEVSVLRVGGGALTPTILTGKLALGQNILMARFLIKQPVDGSAPVGSVLPIQSYVIDGPGDSRPISPWSRPKKFSDGNWYRAGFQTNATDSPAVVLQSTDNQETWDYLSTIAYDGATPRRFNEADIVETSTGNVLAWIGEVDPAGLTRPIWYNTSADLCATWGTATLYTAGTYGIISGNQPQLDLLVDGKIQGMLADREGTSGLSNIGMPIDNTRNRTGIAHFLSLDGSATDFRYRTMMLPFRGSDGGQPAPVEFDDGEMFFASYGVRRNDELTRVVMSKFTLAKLFEGY